MKTPTTAPRPRSVLLMIFLAFLFIFVPFLTWYLTWFGRPLTDRQIERYLDDQEKPRHIQHALSQIADRILRGDPSVRRWYPKIVSLAEHSRAEIRVMVAWVMGQDNRSEEFHRALKRLLNDPAPMVRRNAALGLVRFGDGSGRTEIQQMLRFEPIRAPEEGTVTVGVSAGDDVRAETLLARIRCADGRQVDVRAPWPGRIERLLVASGAHVRAGEVILSLAPESQQVYEALRALYFIGREEDLPEVERYAQAGSEWPEAVREQARRTAHAIRQRQLQVSP
ncbi:MAG: biotin/lipoyl-binding protein [Blastocatellia bacterium]|nr:biotin/lipoyl-binding protein [Blastocatellia bacterium]MCS7156837.1 biotin/lipoyl-binding protein [Blastocatellia bacterium]MCX7752795.1 biotin/lipoyl-binding protein [Blastocatellia bacterium]MDW8167528.1 biotin/lipoyl-binding protein [Acidobacteriota bacterium]MDW8256875.1 biotin/lipoyl-binding protein [Acidobacteriota bacterium]